MDAILSSFFFFFNDTATTEIYTLSLHDALPICLLMKLLHTLLLGSLLALAGCATTSSPDLASTAPAPSTDRKSTRLNSSHGYNSYAVFCLQKKNIAKTMIDATQSDLGSR